MIDRSALLEDLPDVVLVVADGALCFANAAARRRFAAPARTALIELVHPDDHAAVQHLVRQAADGEAPPLEVRLLDLAGTPVPCELLGRAALADRPTVVLVARDLAGRQRLRELRLGADLTTAVSDLASRLGHEINNPLTYILGNLDALREALPGLLAGRGGQDDELMSLVDDAIVGADRVRQIVKYLRTVAGNRTGIREQPLELGRVARLALALVKRDLVQRAEVFLEGIDGAEVLGEEGSLAQILVSLFEHAADEILPGAPKLHLIRVRLARLGDDEVELNIWHEGPVVARREGGRHANRLGPSLIGAQALASDLGCLLAFDHGEAGLRFSLRLRAARPATDRDEPWIADPAAEPSAPRLPAATPHPRAGTASADPAS